MEPILLEGPRPKLGRRPLGIRPPRDQDLSTFNIQERPNLEDCPVKIW